MNSIPTSPAGTVAAAPSASQRETRQTGFLVAVALLAGMVLQTWIPPGGLTLVAGSALAGALVYGLSFVVPGKLRQTLCGFRFISTLLLALSIFAILGTLVLQGKPAEFYLSRYGFAGKLIVALRLDDIFHGLPFAGLMALFGSSVIASSALRFPVKLRNAGFFICHVGLITSLAGAAASATLALRGRIDLHAGGEVARQVRLTKAGMPSGEFANLGFDLKLDKFDLVNYETEYRVGYYEKTFVQDEHGVHEQWSLKASFDPDTEKHRLPSGDSFRLKAVYPDFVQQAKVEPVAQGGTPALEATLDGQTRWLVPGEDLVTPDRRAAVVFGWERPAAPEGVLTAFLVSAADKKVVVHTADGESSLPFAEGMSLAGGVVKLGALVPQARRTLAPGTASQEWRNPAAELVVQQQGLPKEQLMFAARPAGFFLAADRALVFEKRDKEVKSYLSHVTATSSSDTDKATIAVNTPFTFSGWTLYQVNYNPEDPTYSGLEAVYDPGVPWVFTGFALISIGVAYMFYVEPRYKAKAKTEAAA